MSDKFFRYALLISLLIHVAVLTRWSYANKNPFRKSLKDLEITYFKMKTSASNPKASVQTKEDSSKPPTEVNLKKDTQTSSFLKDIAKLFGKMEAPQKKPAVIEKSQVKRKISLPPIKSEKINSPSYLNYYQTIREEIKIQTYRNYDQYDTGEVYLTFIISSDGQLKEIKLIPERSSATAYLEEISLKSVRQSAPFPPFPENLKYPELTFNVVISYQLEQ